MQIRNRFNLRLLIFLFLWLILFPGIFHLLTNPFHLNQYAQFAYPTIITPAIFFVIYLFYRRELTQYTYPQNKWHTLAFSALALVFMGIYLSLYEVVKLLILNGIFLSSWLQLFMVYGTLTVMYIFVFLAVFNKPFFRHFKTLTGLFFLFNTLYYLLFYLLFPHWGLFSKMTAVAVFYFLNPIFPGSYLVTEGNNVGLFIGSFSVGIGEACSGVMLTLLFITLYSLFSFIKPKQISILKGILFLTFGTIGAFSLNIFRVFLLMVIGTQNPQVAMGLFHDNATWILFVSYFLFYLYFTYPATLKKYGD